MSPAGVTGLGVSAPVSRTDSDALTARRAAEIGRWDGLLRRLGIGPMVGDVVAARLDAALPAAGARVLDAGCGRRSQLADFRPRVAELTGVDIHEPMYPLWWADRFVRADICTDADAFEPASFDVVLSSFAVEHLAQPEAAFRNIEHWLRPGGTLVLTTVNRAHPFVDAYLRLSPRLRGRAQRAVKYADADAHPVIGAANRPVELRRALSAAGFETIDVVTCSNLARAWGRRLPTLALGLVGDLVAQRAPSRRSTIVASARRTA